VSSATAPVAAAHTLPARLLCLAGSSPKRVAFRYKDRGLWGETTWARYAERVSDVATGLAELGVGSGDRVAIHSLNRPEWVVADLAAQGLGAVTVGIYPTSPASEVQYLLSHSGARVLIAEDEEQFDKAWEVRGSCPALEAIVVIDPRGVRVLDDPMVHTFADLEAAGDADRDAGRATYRDSVGRLDPSAPAIIVYTSGTTGPPKGAMLSHANLEAAGDAATSVFEVGPRDEVLSYLPLCHVAERLFSLIDHLAVGYVVNFGGGIEELPIDLPAVQPTFFLGVPRVWEKLLATVEIRMADASWLKRTVYRRARASGERVATRRMNGRFGILDKVRYGWWWALLYRPLRDKLGLRRCKVALSGAAPVAPQVLEWFWAIGVPVVEGYGQTENTAQATVTRRDHVRLGAVGQAVPGMEVKIADDGEILTRGPGVFLGYFRDEKATDETIDADGWLHTGDIGTLADDGSLTITDRKKDIIITAGGKNLSPSEIENRLKVSPYVREAVVIGDRRPYLVALIGVEEDTVGDWLSRRQIPHTTYADMASLPEVRELVDEWVAAVNADLAQVETVKQFALLPKELDHEDGEVTATQKVKRRAIEAEFGALIEALYEREHDGSGEAGDAAAVASAVASGEEGS
jgi:long-chain acyl-CoA synthetase